jgi:hypothetical protein
MLQIGGFGGAVQAQDRRRTANPLEKKRESL